jgi:hypothetical protein
VREPAAFEFCEQLEGCGAALPVKAALRFI